MLSFRKRIFCFAALFLLLGCKIEKSDDNSSTSSTSSSTSASTCVDSTTDTTTDINFTVSGSITYDYVPVSISSKLDYANTTQKPLRGVSIRLVDGSTGETLSTTTTSVTGAYTLNLMDRSNLKIHAYSESCLPNIIVEDNTSSDAIYVAESSSFSYEGTSITNKDFNIASGWSGTNTEGSYSGTRASAPFGILDSMYSAAKKFLDVRPTVEFPTLKVNWSINNLAEGGDKSTGQIVTSHWDGTELYILGKADSDTDEYDKHVIVHEWAHYFEDKLGRSDSIGGSHSGGDVLDPRVAFGEAWGNALSAIVFDPDTVYRDTSGSRQQTGFGIDMECSDCSLNENPGWYSETSLQRIIYDIYDSSSDSSDGISLGIGPIYDVMVGAQKTTPYLTTIFSFVKGLKDSNSNSSAALDTLVQVYGIEPIIDAYGSTENDFSSLATYSAVYQSISAGTPITGIQFKETESANRLWANRYFRVTGISGSHTITTQISRSISTDDLDLYLYEDGTKIARAATSSGNETLTFTASSSKQYVLAINLYKYDGIADNVTLSLTAN